MLILALESSTSSAKAMLYDAEFGVIRTVSKAYPASICADGISDTAAITDLTLSLGVSLIEQLRYGEIRPDTQAPSDSFRPCCSPTGIRPFRPSDIAAIALCGTWHNIGVCEDRSLAHPGRTYSWNNLSPASSCRAIRANTPLRNELYFRTGCMPNVTYVRHALYDLASQGMDLRGHQFISQAAYTFYLLTGEYAESHSTMSGSGLLNIHSLQYDDFILRDFLHIEPDQLGMLTDYRQTALLSAEGARLLGLCAGIPVVPAYPDGALNQVASSALHPVHGFASRSLPSTESNRASSVPGSSRMTLSIGTSAALRLSSAKPLLPQGQQLWCYYGVDSWIVGAATSGACNCINWFMQDILKKRFSFADFEHDISDPASLPVFLPFLFGERCPGWRDEAHGGFVERTDDPFCGDLDALSLTPKAAEGLFRGIEAGISANLYQCYQVLTDELGEPDEVLVSGGVLHSPVWTQMIADFLGHSLWRMCVPDASTLGAAVLGLCAAGALKDPSAFGGEPDGAPACPETIGTTESETVLQKSSCLRPDPRQHEAYMNFYKKYLHFYSLDSQ